MGNFGIFGNLEILDFSEILEFLELIFRRADCDPSDDRPCTTTRLYLDEYQYTYIYIYIDTPTNTITNTNTDIDHLLNAQASTSSTFNIARLSS